MTTLQLLHDEPALHESWLVELKPEARVLFAQLCAIERGCALLRYLDANANTLHTVDDIAYYLIEPCSTMEQALAALEDLGLARRVNVAGLTLFGITNDEHNQQLAHEVCVWQDNWHARLARIELWLDGKEPRRDNGRGLGSVPFDRRARV